MIYQSLRQTFLIYLRIYNLSKYHNFNINLFDLSILNSNNVYNAIDSGVIIKQIKLLIHKILKKIDDLKQMNYLHINNKLMW